MQSPLAEGKRESQTAASDWRWVLLKALLTLAVPAIPIAAGYASQKPGRVFVGADNDIQDYHSHLAKMQLGARGKLAYRSLFTPEPMPGHRVILFYNVLGWFAAHPNRIQAVHRFVGVSVVIVKP